MHSLYALTTQTYSSRPTAVTLVSMILRMAVACQLAHVGLAVNFLFDETVWTKQTWPAFKLHFPSHRILQSAPHTTAFQHVSEKGPWSEGSYAQAQSMYGTCLLWMRESSFIVSTSYLTVHTVHMQVSSTVGEENTSCCRVTYDYQDTVPDEVVGLLAQMVKCQACQTLTGSIWHLGIHWLHKSGQQMSDRELTNHMQAMCEILVRVTAIHSCNAYWCCTPATHVWCLVLC